MPGSCTASAVVAAGDSVLATFDALGSVNVRFRD
jgi:2-keto-4-pentenoate hydratase